MANCPNCGSNDIQLKQDRTVNWGRAIAGWALFGVVGGAVGAVTGENKTANACLDCGTVWRAQDLYKLLGIIESLTDIKLDLKLEKDRRTLNIFVTNVQPQIDKLESANKRYDIAIAEKKNSNDSFLGSLILGIILTSFGLLIIITTIIRNAGWAGWFMASPILILGLSFIMSFLINNTFAVNSQNALNKLVTESKLNLKQSIQKFYDNYINLL